MGTIKEAKIKEIIKNKFADLKERYEEKREFDRKYENIRIRSIDFLRGCLVIFTIFLICQGLESNVKKNYLISKWSGFTMADSLLVFFIMVMGMSIPFYVKKHYIDGRSIAEIKINIFKRALIIFIIGLGYSALFMPAKAYLRLSGPFQLIAIDYLISAMIYIGFLKKRVKNNALTYVFIMIGSVISIIFTVIAFKGGMSSDKNTFIYLDNLILQGFKSKSLADPEGILACLAALPLAMYGLAIACVLNKKHIEHKRYIRYRRSHMIREYGFSRENLWIDLKSRLNRDSINSLLSNYYRINNEAKKIVNLFLLGVTMLIFSAIIGIWLDYNRNVFSLPFVLRIAAIMFILVDILYIILDLIRIEFPGRLIRKIGQNAIFVILLVTITNNLLNLIKIKSIYTGRWMNFNNWFTTDFILPQAGMDRASAVYALLITVIWTLILNLLEKYDIKINI